MSLVFAALCPHSPILVPEIGRENREKLQKTISALSRLEEDLYLSYPDIIFVLSPHEALHEKAFVINVHETFTANFEEFGDLEKQNTWKGSEDLGAKIAHKAIAENISIKLINEEKIRYGTSIPLMYLCRHLKNTRVVPIGYSNLSPKDHFSFGEMLKEIIAETPKRIAVIASGDMSHCITKKSPIKYNLAGKEFDQKIQELLSTHNSLGITQLDEKLINNAHECMYKSLLIASGILKNIDYRFENYCYEYPFGVGHLTGNFHL
jgi:aromatic ring-opening dioxygenase LigB subunit